MKTPVEHVWERLKQSAHDDAARGLAPTPEEAMAFVKRCCHEFRVLPAPTQDIVEFFANEYIDMVRRVGANAQET